MEFKDDLGNGKFRPIVVIKISEDNSNIFALGVYSYKDKFIDQNRAKFYNNFLYKLKDVDIAGLDERLISFVDVSGYEQFDLQEMINTATI